MKRQVLSRALARYELFKKILNVKGSIIECGVQYGDGVMAWAELSNLLEPYAIHRKVIGFDTFEGFPQVSEKDKFAKKANPRIEKGFLSLEPGSFEKLQERIKGFDASRYLNKEHKIELVKGNAIKTIPEYIKKNQYLIVSLLFLDFDLYKPTKVALDKFLPRIPKGGIVAFDQINNRFWQGETIALMECFESLNGYRLEKFNFDHNIAYMVI